MLRKYLLNKEKEGKRSLFVITCEKINNVWFGIALNDEKQIVTSNFSVTNRSKVLSSIIEYLPLNSEFREKKHDKYAFRILNAMSQICEGKLVKYNFILALEKLPQFTRQVLNLTTKIPKGFVATYGGLAKAVGNPQGARAVGNVQARNPFAPIVPCHRVVSSTLDLGGYGGGLDTKRLLLEREGVIFEGKRISTKCHWVPKE